MSFVAEIHILLSKGFPMIDIIGNIVNAISGFFTSVIELVSGSIAPVAGGDDA